MRTKIVRIGKSHVVSSPAQFIEEAQFGDEVRLRVVAEENLIRGVATPRAGWGEASVRLRRRGEDGLLDEPLPTDFDQTEWNWSD